MERSLFGDVDEARTARIALVASLLLRVLREEGSHERAGEDQREPPGKDGSA